MKTSFFIFSILFISSCKIFKPRKFPKNAIQVAFIRQPISSPCKCAELKIAVKQYGRELTDVNLEFFSYKQFNLPKIKLYKPNSSDSLVFHYTNIASKQRFFMLSGKLCVLNKNKCYSIYERENGLQVFVKNKANQVIGHFWIGNEDCVWNNPRFKGWVPHPR